MATTNNKQAPEAAKPVTVSNKKRLFVIGLLVVGAAASAAGGMWFYMNQKQQSTHLSTPHTEEPAEAPVFLPLEAMTVNLLSDDGQQHYLRIGLTVKLADAASQQQLSDHMPEIRSRVLLALSNKHPDDLGPIDAKRDLLAVELKALIEQPTDRGLPPVRVSGVLLTDFVVQ